MGKRVGEGEGGDPGLGDGKEAGKALRGDVSGGNGRGPSVEQDVLEEVQGDLQVEYRCLVARLVVVGVGEAFE